MKKYFNKLLFLSIISLFILIPTKTRAAADDIVMYMQCSYSVISGASDHIEDGSLYKHQNGEFKIHYTEINDSAGKPFILYSGYASEFETLENKIDKITKSINIAKSTNSDIRNSFVTEYASTKQCPKYMVVEEIGSDDTVRFYNKISGSCENIENGKCMLIYQYDNETYVKDYKKVVSPLEDSWSLKTTADSAGVCSDINLEINVSSSKQLTAMSLYGPASKYKGYTNWASPKVIEEVDFNEIYTLATRNTVSHVIFDPDDKEIMSIDNTGLYFANDMELFYSDPTGSIYCQLYDKTYATNKKCTLFSEVEANINSYNTAFYTKYNALKAEADKYLTKNNITYIINDGISDSTLGSIAVAAKINSAITDFESLNKSQSGETVDYLKSLIDGGTLCSDDEAKVAELLNELSSQISDGKQIIIGLKNVLEKMKANFIASGDKENANIVDGYINNANSAIDKLNVISRKARESYLASTNFNIVGQIGGSTCNIISTDLREFLQTIVDYVRIIGIVLAIILGILDYIKVIFGSDEKSMSKANKNMMTRIIAVALLFLIPAILNFALGLFDVYGSDTGTCGVE